MADLLSDVAVERALIKGICNDCGKTQRWNYMVEDETWNKAWPEYKQLREELTRRFPRLSIPSPTRIWLDLCISCLELRLNRDLVGDDFNLQLPINAAIYFGVLLKT